MGKSLAYTETVSTVCVAQQQKQEMNSRDRALSKTGPIITVCSPQPHETTWTGQRSPTASGSHGSSSGRVETKRTNPSPPFRPQPPRCSHFFLLCGVYYRRHGNMCEPACVRRYMRSYSYAARVTVLHLAGTARVQDCPAVPNIAHPELAYTEKPKGKQHKEETADCFMGTKALCVSIFTCSTLSKNTGSTSRRPPTMTSFLSGI